MRWLLALLAPTRRLRAAGGCASPIAALTALVVLARRARNRGW